MSRPTKLYIAKFGSNVGRRDIEDTFRKFGEVYSCNMNSRDGYATVAYKYEEDAQKAISKLNGTETLGGKLLVEHTLKKSREDGYSRPPRDDRYGGSGNRDQNGYRGSRYGDSGSDRDRGSSFRSGTRGPPRADKEKFIKDGLCFTCGQQGHISRKCPEARDGYGGRGRDSGMRSDRDRRSYRERSRSFDRSKDKRRENRSRSPHSKHESKDKRRERKHSKRSSSSSSRSNNSESKSRRNRRKSSSSSRSNSNSSRSGSSSNHRNQGKGDKNYNGNNPHDQKRDTSSQH